MKVFKRFLIIIFILILLIYIGISSYKFIILNNISKKYENYKSLDNYSYIRILPTVDYTLKEQVFYKNGILNMKLYHDGKLEGFIYGNLMNSQAYYLNDTTKTQKATSYNVAFPKDNGIYRCKPSFLDNNLLLDSFLHPFSILVGTTDSTYIVKFRKERYEFNKDTGLLEKHDNDTFDFKLNNVQDSDVLVNLSEYTAIE